jgi:hypothetical protein
LRLNTCTSSYFSRIFTGKDGYNHAGGRQRRQRSPIIAVEVEISDIKHDDENKLVSPISNLYFIIELQRV